MRLEEVERSGLARPDVGVAKWEVKRSRHENNDYGESSDRMDTRYAKTVTRMSLAAILSFIGSLTCAGIVALAAVGG